MERSTIFAFLERKADILKTCKIISNNLPFSNQDSADEKLSNEWHLREGWKWASFMLVFYYKGTTFGVTF